MMLMLMMMMMMMMMMMKYFYNKFIIRLFFSIIKILKIEIINILVVYIDYKL